jgi:rod shape determining protein RodA
MSQDFVRRLPDTAFYRQRSVLGETLHLDFTIIFFILLICGYGLVILSSAVERQSEPVTAQLIKLGVAFTTMVVIAQISPVVFLRLAPWLYGLGLILLVAVLFVGTSVNGSMRWLRVPGVFNFQPSELMKLVLPMVLAAYFHDRHLPPRPRHLFWAALMIGLPALLTYKEPDLGTALLIGASGFIVLLLAGIPWRYVWGVVAIAAAAAPALWFDMSDYQKHRILNLFNPERDPLGTGWNTIQAKTAIGSGGVFGKGLFEGTQSHLDFLPESQTDFIIAVMAEELGLVGVVCLLLLYMLLIGRGVIISVQAQDTFGRLLAGTITFTFFVYVFVNIGMVSGILPIVGVPLPLVSYGGTSIVTLFAGFGMLMSIHTHRRITLK